MADAEGSLVASAGDPSRVTFARSSMKPLQAAVSLSLVDDEPTDAEVAVMCASHNAEPVHLAAVDALLARAEMDRGALQTPPGWPLDAETARAVGGPAPELHNCSGKHAGMLLACRRQGLDERSYREADHPLQQRVLDAVRHLAGNPDAIGIDGCGVPVHALPLAALARLFAGFVDGRVEGAAEAVAAMQAKPYMVAGRERICTAVMERVPDVIVKVGAEGLVCAGLLGRGLGVAIKIEDGASRAADPALIHVLRLLGVRVDDPSLEGFTAPPVLGGGRPVGRLVAEFDLAS